MSVIISNDIPEAYLSREQLSKCGLMGRSCGPRWFFASIEEVESPKVDYFYTDGMVYGTGIGQLNTVLHFRSLSPQFFFLI